MKKWELARYIIDAKKCVDSLYYISDNLIKLKNLNLRHIVKERESEFYLNLSFVLDDCFKNKRELCQKNPCAKTVYYKRDKNIAHKDEDYKGNKINKIFLLGKELETLLRDVFNICRQFLPLELTLDFLHYDKDLFRFVNHITPELEEKIKGEKYPRYNEKPLEDSKLEMRNIIYDVDELKELDDKTIDKSAVLVEAGLNMYEIIQNEQDSMILINCLYNQKIWPSLNKKWFMRMEKLKKQGIIDEFDMLVLEKCTPDVFKELSPFFGGGKDE